jgi:TolB-like protein/predicted Ser/Thr protein kinase
VIGRTLGHYRIETVLGQGGMGEVYLAFDLHLERYVAVKVLPQDLVADEAARRRLRREALALSKLQHPHIATVHDFDEQEGVAFLVMERIEGETLEQRIERGPLPEAEVRRIGEQIASALAAAHAHGVVHSDLKPANVLLDARGQAKVVDFGIARRFAGAGPSVLSTTMAIPDVLRGTIPYMAPEQLLGRNLDGRADLFALGVVMHHMASGRLPFPGDSTIAVANAILNDPPTPLEPQEGSTALQSILQRCMEKRPEARFQSAAELEAALRGEASSQSTAHAVADRSHARGSLLPRSRRLRVALASVAVLAAVLAVALLVQRTLPRAGPQALEALAVLPLQNLSADADQEYFADGMTDELIVRLSQVNALRVISRASSMTYKGSPKSSGQIARELDVDGLITGSVQRVGDRVRIRAQLVDAKHDRSVWASSYERDTKDALALQSEIAQAIVEHVRVRLRPAERARLSATRTVIPEAHEHYLRGRFYWNNFDPEYMRRAADEFRRAVEIDPSYAEAYAGLSDAYALMSGITLPTSEAMPRARAAAERALELDPDLPSANASLGYVLFTFDRDWNAAEKRLRRALELNPNEPSALQAYGYFHHVNGHFAEATALFRRARTIDPLSSYVAAMNLWPLNQGRQYERAIAGTGCRYAPTRPPGTRDSCWPKHSSSPGVTTKESRNSSGSSRRSRSRSSAAGWHGHTARPGARAKRSASSPRWTRSLARTHRILTDSRWRTWASAGRTKHCAGWRAGRTKDTRRSSS